MRQDGNRIEIESESTTGGVENEFAVEVEPEHDSLSLSLEFSSEANSSEVELSFKVKFKSLFEFEESSATFDGFDPTTDTIGTECIIGTDTSAFTALVLSSVPSPDNPDLDILRFSVGSNDGVVSLLGKVSDAPFNESLAGRVTRNQIKVDVKLAFGTTASTQYTLSSPRLALRAQVETETEMDDVEQIDQGTLDKIAVGVNNGGALIWVPHVLCNRTSNATVVATTSAVNREPDDEDRGVEENVRDVFFAFDCERRSSISWDPSISVRTTALSPGSAAVNSVSCLLCAVTVFLATFLLHPCV